MRKRSAKQQARVDEIKAKYASGRTVQELASDYGLCASTVADYLGFSYRPYMTPIQKRNDHQRRRERKRKGHPEMKADYDAGMTVPEIAAKYGLKPTTVCTCLSLDRGPYLDKMQREHRKKQKGNNEAKWRKLLTWHYRKEGMSVPAIAERYGLKERTVCGYLRISIWPYLSEEQRKTIREKQRVRMRDVRAAKKVQQ